jgi:hypothetical protein
MGALSAARRTDAAFPAYLASSHASDVQLFVYDLSSNNGNGVSQSIGTALAALPQVERVATSPYAFLVPFEAAGSPVSAAIAGNDVNFIGSIAGANFTTDRPAVVAGRMPNPNAVDEVAASTDAAALLGWHLGERVELDAYSVRQVERSASYPPPAVPVAHVAVTLVGLVTFASEVAHDDVDRYPTYVLVTPALTRRFPTIVGYSNYELRLRAGAGDDAAVEREIANLIPPGTVYEFHLTSVVEGQVERAIRPEVVALWAFGAIAAVAALLIGALAMRRRTSSLRVELDIARALGADRATLVAAGSIGAVATIVSGALVAAVLTVASSPLAPIGVVRAVDESPGFEADWTVLTPGVALMVIVLTAVVVLALISDLQRAQRGAPASVARRSAIADVTGRSGLPTPAVLGLRFSLERGAGTTGAAVRSALAAAVVAVVVVVATATFASGLATLNSRPSLYGWNWDVALLSPNGTDVPPAAERLLGHDPLVAAWSGYSFANASLNGVTVPIILANPHARVGLSLSAGHGLDQAGQIVLGAETLAQLHLRLGGTVAVSYGSKRDYPVYVPPTRVRIVGIATMPAIGSSGNLHTSMGLGAEIATGIEPAAFRAALHNKDPNLNGSQIAVVRFKPGTPLTAGLASLRTIAHDADHIMAADPNGGGAAYVVVGPQRPAEIVIFQSTGATPALLAIGLAVGAVAALALALTSSVRRRRRDLALLKTLGFERRQLASTIAWQASTIAAVDIVFGVPLGVALGRWLWTLFAHQIGVVPQPSVPVVQIVLIATAAVVLANLVSAIPGRLAARTPAALVLRSE